MAKARQGQCAAAATEDLAINCRALRTSTPRQVLGMSWLNLLREDTVRYPSPSRFAGEGWGCGALHASSADANVTAHRRLLEAARRRDTDQVRRLMLDHIDEAGGLAAELDAAVRQRFVRDAGSAGAHSAARAGSMTCRNRCHPRPSREQG